jgi:hypothetical protein
MNLEPARRRFRRPGAKVAAASLPGMTASADDRDAAHYEALLDRFASAAAQDLPPLRRELSERIGATAAEAEVIHDVLVRAWMAGAHTGQMEVLAQTIEQGAELDHRLLRPPSGAGA